MSKEYQLSSLVYNDGIRENKQSQFGSLLINVDTHGTVGSPGVNYKNHLGVDQSIRVPTDKGLSFRGFSIESFGGDAKFTTVDIIVVDYQNVITSPILKFTTDDNPLRLHQDRPIDCIQTFAEGNNLKKDDYIYILVNDVGNTTDFIVLCNFEIIVPRDYRR